MIITKSIKRIVEILTKKYYRMLVDKSIAFPAGNDHATIRKYAQRVFGLTNDKRPLNWLDHWRVDFINQAIMERVRLKNLPTELGKVKIGFEDLSIVAHLDNINSSIVYFYGFADNMSTFMLYENYVKRGDVVLDIGGNLGLHSLVLSRCVGEQGRVITFEPVERIYERLSENLEMNDIKNVDARKIGIGEHSGLAKFNDNADDINIGRGRLNPQGNIEIKVSTMDEQCLGISEPISLIKIDIEGFELNALKGGQMVLANNRPAIVCEYNTDSYSYAQLTEMIPYSCVVYTIPLLFSDQLKKLGEFDEYRGDVLILPDEYPPPMTHSEYFSKSNLIKTASNIL